MMRYISAQILNRRKTNHDEKDLLLGKLYHQEINLPGYSKYDFIQIVLMMIE